MKVTSFTLCKIKGKDRYRWYALFRNPDTGGRMNKKSVEKLRKLLGDFSGTPITKYSEAYEICSQVVAKGILFTSSIHSPLVDYLLQYWDWEKSPAIKRKITVDPGSIGPDYAHTRLTLMRKHIIPLIPSSLTVAQVNSNHLRQWQYELVKQNILAPTTINQILSSVYTALKDGMEGSTIGINHIRLPKALTSHTHVRGILSESEVKLLLHVAAADKDPRFYLAASLSLVTGMRSGELRALRMNDIDHGLITVRRAYADIAGEKLPKGKRIRQVPCPEFLCEKLKAFSQINPYLCIETINPLVFWSRRGGSYISSHFLAQKMQQLLITGTIISKEEIDKRNISFHSFRHMANTLLRGSVDESTLRLTIGHQSEQMSNIYTHLTEGGLKKVREAQKENILPFIIPGDNTAINQ